MAKTKTKEKTVDSTPVPEKIVDLTSKPEKLVDLAPKPEKVTDEQLNKIQDIVNRINRTQMEIGQLESRKHQALHFMAGTNDELSLLQNELREKYGTDNINIQDGTIIYPQNEQTDKKD